MINYKKNISLIVFLFVIIATISSCSQYESQQNNIPENLIEKSDFKDVMLDIRMLEVIIRQDVTTNNGNDVDSITAHYYEYIFTKHNISQEQFQASLLYYTNRPEDLNEINNAVVDSLNIIKEIIKPKE